MQTVSGTVSAVNVAGNSIIVSRPAPVAPKNGKKSAISSSALLSATSTLSTISVTSSTTIKVDGKKATLSDISDSMKVSIRSTKSTDGTLIAFSIQATDGSRGHSPAKKFAPPRTVKSGN